MAANPNTTITPTPATADDKPAPVSLAECFHLADAMENDLGETLDHATAIRVHLNAVPAKAMQTVYKLLEELEARVIAAEKKRDTLFHSLHPHRCKPDPAPDNKPAPASPDLGMAFDAMSDMEDALVSLDSYASILSLLGDRGGPDDEEADAFNSISSDIRRQIKALYAMRSKAWGVLHPYRYPAATFDEEGEAS